MPTDTELLPLLLESLEDLLDDVLDSNNEREEEAEVAADALGQLSKFCLREDCIPAITQQPQLVSKMTRIANLLAPADVANRALICLGNLALFPAKSHLPPQVSDMALRTMQRMLEGDKKTDADVSDDEMDCALSCAFILCRQGGAELLERTPVVREKLFWILTEVLDAGAEGTVLGFSWDPANILQDVATLASSDRLKPLVCDFIPLVVRALKERARGNFRLVKFAVRALTELVFTPKSFADFYAARADIHQVLRQLLNNARARQEELDYVEVREEADALLALLDALHLPTEKASSSSVVVTPPAAEPSPKHVLISYQVDDLRLASDIQVRLVEDDRATWMDILDMGQDFEASMQRAVEGAVCMLSVVSNKYLTTATCQQDVQRAVEAKLPIVVVIVVGQEEEEPTWMKESAFAVIRVTKKSGADDELDEDAWTGILRALTALAPPPSPLQLQSAASSSQEEEEEDAQQLMSAQSLQGEAEQGMFHLLIDMMGELKRENMQIKQQMKALEGINALILADMDKLKEEVDRLTTQQQQQHDE